MIIKDLRKNNKDMELNKVSNNNTDHTKVKEVRELNKEDLANILFERDFEISNWGELADYIRTGRVDVSKINLSDVIEEFDKEYILFGWFVDELKATEKELLFNCDTGKVSKYTFSKLLCLDFRKEEFDFVKTLVNRIEDIDQMYFYDFSENDFDEEKTIELISEKLNINVDNLYPCYPYNLFKNEYFNPTLITNLTSECGLEVEDYENFEFNVVLI